MARAPRCHICGHAFKGSEEARDTGSAFQYLYQRTHPITRLELAQAISKSADMGYGETDYAPLAIWELAGVEPNALYRAVEHMSTHNA